MSAYYPPGSHFAQIRGFPELILQALQGYSPVKLIDGTCKLLILLLESSTASSGERRKQNLLWLDVLNYSGTTKKLLHCSAKRREQ